MLNNNLDLFISSLIDDINNKDYNEKEKIILLKKIIEIFQIVFENDDYDEYNKLLININIVISNLYYEIKDQANYLKYIDYANSLEKISGKRKSLIRKYNTFRNSIDMSKIKNTIC